MLLRTATLALLFASTAPLVAAEANELPNIVVVLADDMGYGDVHALNPSSKIPTPNLDRLAARGMTFTDAHSPSAVCTPTRYGLLTGRYCWRGRLKSGVINGYGARVIEEGRQTVASLLASVGYHTAIVGKWHLGLGWVRKSDDPDSEIDFTAPVGDPPGDFGFEMSYIIPASLDFPPYVYLENGRVTEPATVAQEAMSFPVFLRKGPRSEALVMEDVLDHLTDRATAYIAERAQAEEPFFLYFPLSAPHKPVLPHDRFRGKTALGDYGDFVVQVDDVVGRITAALQAAGVADETLLLYTSDNGSFMYRLDDPSAKDHVDDAKIQSYRADRHRANGPLRGTKADIWEAGHRVPFFAVWPGQIEAGSRCDVTISLTDVFATCAEITGAKIEDEAGEDSYGFLPLLSGETGDWGRPPVVHHSANGMFAMRDGPWKLVLGNGSGGRQQPKGKPFEEPYQLYDLSADLGETKDLASEHPEHVVRLTAILDSFRVTGRSVGR